MPELIDPNTEGQHWHPAVEKSRVTDPKNEDYGKSRIDSPLGADISMDTAKREMDKEELYPGAKAVRDNVLDQGEAELIRKNSKKGLLRKASEAIDEYLDPRGYAQSQALEGVLIEKDAEKAMKDSLKFDREVREKKK